MPTTYLEFLALLKKLYDKVPRLLEFVEKEQNLLMEYSDLLTLAPSHNAPAITQEVLTAEGELIALMPASHGAGEHGKIGDGALLRAAWAFIQANPWILQLLLKT